MRTLVIGFGNLYRADDGLAFYVVNALRARLGQPLLTDEESGLGDMGSEIDSLFLPQLVPELVDILTPYSTVVFVDASVVGDTASLNVQPVEAKLGPSAFTHHISPSMLLALAGSLRGSIPASFAVCVRGQDFGFRCGLSPDVESRVPAAVECIMGLASGSSSGFRQA